LFNSYAVSLFLNLSKNFIVTLRLKDIKTLGLHFVCFIIPYLVRFGRAKVITFFIQTRKILFFFSGLFLITKSPIQKRLLLVLNFVTLFQFLNPFTVVRGCKDIYSFYSCKGFEQSFFEKNIAVFVSH
jgi:hypothetical protein